MKKYRRVHMPEPLHKQIKNYVERSKKHQSIDQLCREAAEKIIEEHHLIKQEKKGGKTKTKWKSANIPEEYYEKIKAWIKKNKSPYVSVDEAMRDAIRDTLKGVF